MAIQNSLISEEDCWTRVGPRVRRSTLKARRSGAAPSSSTRRVNPPKRRFPSSVLYLFPKPTKPLTNPIPSCPSPPFPRRHTMPLPATLPTLKPQFPLSSLSAFRTFKDTLLLNPPFSSIDNRPKRPRPSSSEGGSHPLPALNPSDPYWVGRCFKCSEKGHDRANCPGKSSACKICNEFGHDAKSCKKNTRAFDRAAVVRKKKNLDNLVPRGFIGEKEFPDGRPEIAEVFIPHGPDQVRDMQKLASAVVIDTRLMISKAEDSLQPSLMAVCNAATPFTLIHMADVRYIMLLPKGTDRSEFLQSFGPKLEDLGIVAYPWSAAIDAEPAKYNFKVWLDLLHVPIQGWNLNTLVPLVAQVGLLLDHTQLENVTSLEKL